MTKVHAPLSIENTVTHVAQVMPGRWDSMAQAVGRAPGTIRKWGNPTEREKLPAWAAIKLDIACDRLSLGRPFQQLHLVLLDLARARAKACKIIFARRMGALMRECGEANEALVLYPLTAGSERDAAEVIRELEDVVREALELIAMLKQPRPPPPDTS